MVSDQFKRLRDALGKSQTEFGAGLGVSRSVINNIERSVTAPSEVFLNHLCDVFSVNRTWLETGEGEMFTDKPSEAEQFASAIGESPALQSLLATWAQLSDENKAVFEQFAADYVDDYMRRRAEARQLRTKAAIEHAEAQIPDAEQNQA